MGAQILNDLGIAKIRLITNNPRKIAGLKGYGLEIVDRVPLLIEANIHNSEYLATKAQKMGHLLLQTYLVTIAITWQDNLSSALAQYDKLDKIRYLAQTEHLLLQEEARSIAIALFTSPSLIFHLGFDQANLDNSDWYKDSNHPYLVGLSKVLDQLQSWNSIARLEFLIAKRDDPMQGLQVKLDREHYSLKQKPSTLWGGLKSQVIYTFEGMGERMGEQVDG